MGLSPRPACTHPVDGDDADVAAGDAGELLAQPADVDVEHLGLAGKVGAPQPGEDLGQRHDHVGVRREQVEQVERAGGQVERRSPDAGGAGVRVDLQVAHAEARLPPVVGGRPGGMRHGAARRRCGPAARRCRTAS